MRRALALALMCAIAGAGARGAAAETPPVLSGVRIAPSFDGHFGAWLLYGPYESASHGIKPGPGVTIPDALATDPAKLVEASLTPDSSWIVAATNAGAI